MLTIFYGNDEREIRRKARSQALSLLQNESDLYLFEGDSFHVSRFEEILFSQSIFDDKLQVILCDQVFENVVLVLLVLLWW